MKQNIIDAFKAPLKDVKMRIDIIVGGVLLYFPVINFVAIGYMMKKLKNILEMKKQPVTWDNNLKELFILGARGTGVIVLYLLIPVLLMILEGVFVSFLSQGKIWSLFFIRGQVIGLVKSVLLLAALFLLPFGVCLMIEKDSLVEAFDIREILQRILLAPREYSVVYLSIVGLFLAAFIVTILCFNWVMFLLLAGFIYFYNGLVGVHLIGRIFPRKSITIQILPNNQQELSPKP